MVVGISGGKAGLCLAAAGATIAPAAHAGAWSLAAGKQQQIVSVSRESGEFGVAWRTDTYGEIGLGDGWEVTNKAEGEVRSGATLDDRSGFRIGLQKAFAVGERGSVSVAVSALGGESLDGAECIGGGYEVRAAAGTSFAFLGREGFVNVEAGTRIRGDCNRAAYEIATGLEFAPEWNLGLKAWRDGAGDGGSTKAEISVKHALFGIDFGIGWRREISGNFKESGWLVSAGTRL